MPNIGPDELGFGVELAQLGRKLLADVLAAAGNHHTGAFLGKSDSGRSANSGECTGDQDNGVARASSPPRYGPLRPGRHDGCHLTGAAAMIAARWSAVILGCS